MVYRRYALQDIIYLDNAATSYPKPNEVYVFMDHFYRDFGVSPGRSGYDLCREAEQLVHDTRVLLTEFFNGSDSNRLCFSYNATDALNLIISGMLQPGDHAIATTIEHNAVLRPLYHLGEDRGVEVDYVPFDKNGFVDPDDFPKRFQKNTKLVVVNHASNVTGTVQPVREIGLRCRKHGIPLAIDAAQSAGKIPIDMEELFVDIVVFTGHKSLLGPTGIGGLCVREGIEIRQTRAGGTGVRSAVRTHLPEYPYRLEYGTLNILGVAGLHAAVEWVLSQGLEKLQAHEMSLCEKLRDGLRRIDGVSLYCQDDLTDHIGVLTFNIDGMEALSAGTILDVDHNIACRTGLHCAPLIHEQLGTASIGGSVRFGIGPFNTEADIEAAVNGVAEIAEFYKRE
jgi:cysteine desulfurase/selenocysteine lyase